MPREIKSPNENVAKAEVLNVQDAITKIKEVIVFDINHGVEKKVTEAAINKIIAECVSAVTPAIKQATKNSLIQAAQSMYWSHSRNMKIIIANTSKDLEKKEPSYKAKISNGGLVVNSISPERFREVLDFGVTKGLAVIKRYEQAIKLEIKRMAAENIKSTRVSKNGKPYATNLRNLAEMKVRAEENARDIENLKAENVKLVWTSSHADASARCAPYQGRLWSLDGTSGVIDGNKYSPIEEAKAGPNGDGNGIISGFNCRHRLIEYVKGSKSPTQFSPKEIKQERDKDKKQRYYENSIRSLKMSQALFSKQGDRAEAEKLRRRWKALEEKYKQESLKDGRSYYTWRTQIKKEEKD